MKLAAILVLLLAVALAAPALSAAKPDATAGKAVFAKKCAACHGSSGEGKEAIAKMLKVTMRDLGSKEVQARTDDEIHKIIREGNGKMKAVKEVSASDASNLIAFVRSLCK